MIKVIAFDLVGVLVTEKDIELSPTEDKLERMFGANISDDEYIKTAKTVITNEQDIIKITKEIINKLYERALNAVKGAITGDNNVESFSSADFEKYFIEELKNENIQTTTITTTVNAVKEDNKWKIVSDDALYNAVLPGLQEAVNTLAD